MFKITYLCLAVSLIISFLFLFTSPYLKGLEIRKIVPVIFYPANIIAYSRMSIFLLATKTAMSVPVGERKILSVTPHQRKRILEGQIDLKRSHKVCILHMLCQLMIKIHKGINKK